MVPLHQLLVSVLVHVSSSLYLVQPHCPADLDHSDRPLGVHLWLWWLSLSLLSVCQPELPPMGMADRQSRTDEGLVWWCQPVVVCSQECVRSTLRLFLTQPSESMEYRIDQRGSCHTCQHKLLLCHVESRNPSVCICLRHEWLMSTQTPWASLSQACLHHRRARTVSSGLLCSCRSCDTHDLTSMLNASEREPRIPVPSLHPASLRELCGKGNDSLVRPIRSGMPCTDTTCAFVFCSLCSTLQTLHQIPSPNQSWLSSAFSCCSSTERWILGICLLLSGSICSGLDRLLWILWNHQQSPMHSTLPQAIGP